MIRQRVSLAVVGAVVAGTALSTGLVSPASAASDYDPGFVPAANDLVGVGSDTIEIVMHNLAAAYNATGAAATGKIASFAAAPVEPIEIRAGVSITRPNGSGPGKSALWGASAIPGVSFARSSSSLNGNETTAGLRQYAFAVDGLRLAVSSTTNAPSTITAADMVKIYNGTYTTWGQIPGYDGGAPNATIKPFQPQSGSGTLSFFTAQLTAANGGSPVTLAPSVKPTQEHDPALIQGDPNAIAPFSTARADGVSTIKLVRGFQARRAVYNVVRGADVGTTKIDSVFGAAGFLCSPAAKDVIEDAGFDQLATSATNGGKCGLPTQDAVSYPFVTTSDVETETALSATSSGSTVSLKADVSGNDIAVGKVVFKQGATTVGEVTVNSQTSSASLTLTGVAKGTQTYTASFVPSNSKFKESNSLAATVKVVPASAVAVSPVSKVYGVAGSIPVSVSSAGGPVTGNVSVNAGGVVSSVALVNGAGIASIPATLGVGTYPVTVTYGGSADAAASAASTSLSISKAKSTTTLKFVKKSIKASKKAKATVKVKITGSALKAAGKVTLKAGSKTVGTGTIKNGKVTITLKKLKKGSYKIKATFAGNGNVSKSVTKAVTLKVTK